MKTGVVVVGMGKMGKYYLNTALKLKDECQVLGMIETHPEVREQLKKIPEFSGIPISQSIADSPLGKAHPGLKEIVGIVATSTSTHFKIGLEMLLTKCPFLIEKPLAHDLASARKLLSASKRSNQVVMVSAVERYNPAFEKVQNLVKSGALGEIEAIRTERKGPIPKDPQQFGNVMLDLMIHDLDLLSTLLVVPPALNLEHFEKTQDGIIKEIEASFSVGRGRVEVRAEWTTNGEKSRSWTLKGKKGTLSVDLLGRQGELRTSLGESQKVAISEPTGPPLELQLIEFLDCVGKKEQSSHGPTEGVAVLAVIENLHEQVDRNFGKGESSAHSSYGNHSRRR